jgi:hypothetical protein
MQTYGQCTRCMRLIPNYPAEAQASACPDLFYYVNGQKICWECMEIYIKATGVVPFRKEENR